MAQSQCIRIPLNAEHAEAFIAWLRSLEPRRDELRALLAKEGMLAELVLLEEGPAGAAIILYTRAEDLASANAAYLASEHPIDREMRDWQARALRIAEAKLLDVVFEHGVPG